MVLRQPEQTANQQSGGPDEVLELLRGQESGGLLQAQHQKQGVQVLHRAVGRPERYWQRKSVRAGQFPVRQQSLAVAATAAITPCERSSVVLRAVWELVQQATMHQPQIPRYVQQSAGVRRGGERGQRLRAENLHVQQWMGMLLLQDRGILPAPCHLENVRHKLRGRDVS